MPTGINRMQSVAAPSVEVRPIPLWPEYGVTADGRLWSYRNNKFRAARADKDGYLRVNLSRDGKVTNRKVHIFVAQVWIPNPQNLPIVNHRDGNKGNPHKDNLEWTTPKGNSEHALATGLHLVGERCTGVKLTEELVRLIRSRKDVRPLARELGVHWMTIINVRNRNSWKHI